MFDFLKLVTYQKAKGFHNSCKKIILQNNLDRYVNDQLGRASFSVPLNIAEGSGKFSQADRRRYFIIARASLFECVAIIDMLADDGVLTAEELNSLLKDGDELSRILYTMIKKLS